MEDSKRKVSQPRKMYLYDLGFDENKARIYVTNSQEGGLIVHTFACSHPLIVAETKQA